MFSEEPDSVTSTRIFVAPLNDNNWQLTVYSNQVLTDGKPTAMILPYPTLNDEPCIPLDLTEFEYFFDNIDVMFMKPDRYASRGYYLNESEDDSLSISQIGSYKCSVAKNFQQLNLLKAQEFGLSDSNKLGLPDRLKTELEKHYSTGFGFLICKIEESASFSPIGYVHPLMGGSLFIPTRHDHGEGVQPIWDHSIYAYGCSDKKPKYLDGVLAFAERLDTSLAETTVQLSSFIHNFDKFPVKIPSTMHFKFVHKWSMKGKLLNGDLHVLSCLSLARTEKCTFAITDKHYQVQEVYSCETCGLSGSKGLCRQCIYTCHFGHNISLVNVDEFFCDCGHQKGCYK
jgi:hypothetical protein